MEIFTQLADRKTFFMFLFYVLVTQGAAVPLSPDVAHVSSNWSPLDLYINPLINTNGNILERVRRQVPLSNRCVMPSNSPESRYSLLSGVAVKPGDVVRDQSVLKLDCLAGSDLSTSNVLLCEGNKWTGDIPTCSRHCGTVIPKGVVNVIEGVDARRGEFPWHVAIYSQYGQEGQGLDPKYWCGGSILNRNTVISAAHCFYDPLQRKSFDPSLFTIAVGNMFADFNHTEQNAEMYIQKSVVKNVKIPEFYSGEVNGYAYDVALLTLETPLNFSNLVLPVCLDLNDQNFDEDQLSPGVVARLAGFGLVQADSDSSAGKLKTTSMPLISKNQCRMDSPPEFEKYIVSDKFCAGYLNGTGICKGDTGGGLVVKTFIKNIETWFLRGIMSIVSPADNDNLCNTHTYSTFTRLFSNKIFLENELY